MKGREERLEDVEGRKERRGVGGGRDKKRLKGLKEQIAR